MGMVINKNGEGGESVASATARESRRVEEWMSGVRQTRGVLLGFF